MLLYIKKLKMPPKKQKGFKSSDLEFSKCAGRDITALKKYAQEHDTEPVEVLAYALKKDNKLKYFESSEHDLSNCSAAFPGTGWYGVGVKGTNRYHFYDDNGKETEGIYYFKLVLQNDEPRISNGTFERPSELPMDAQRCEVNGGKCLVKKVTKEAKLYKKEEQKVKQERKVKEKEEIVLPPEIQNLKVDTVEIGTSGLSEEEKEFIRVEAPNVKQQKDRSYFEKMDVQQIIDWMLKNMDLKDILACVRGTALTPEQQETLNEIEGTKVTEVSSESLAKEAIETLPSKEVNMMLKKVTKEEFMEMYNLIPDEYGRLKAIAGLCKECGKYYTVKPVKSTGGYALYDFDEEKIKNVNAVIDKCIDLRSKRFKEQLLSYFRSLVRKVKPKSSFGKKKKVVKSIRRW
jgi:hypothetical protein